MFFFHRYKQVADSGLLRGLTDWHCHLLPAVDDGVKRADESLAILQLWEKLGVKEVHLTPHIMEDIPNQPAVLQEKFQTFAAAWHGTIRLHLAAEHMLDGLFQRRLVDKMVLPLTPDKKLLVETSYFNPPFGMEDMLVSIREADYTIVLAHPERYQYMDMSDYERLHNEGVLFQLNLPSLTGAYGPDVMQKAELLLQKGWYYFCGSDCHSLRSMEAFLNSKISSSIVKSIESTFKKR